MADQHLIAPPQELIDQWLADAPNPLDRLGHVATQAARWGADAELEACCEWLKAKEWIHPEFSDELRDARRPKPPSLKEQALETLSRISKDEYPCSYQDDKDWETIRRALEQLND